MATIMTVRAPDKLQKILSDEAKPLGLTRNGLILQILWDWVDSKETTEKTE